MNRKKLSKILIVLSVLIISLIPAITLVQAAGFHSYKIVGYKDGIAQLKCILCEEYVTGRFMDQYNLAKSDSGYNSGFDVAKDNFINAKDYAKIQKTVYSTESTTKPTTAPSSTTEKVTDKDGWNNEILKP